MDEVEVSSPKYSEPKERTSNSINCFHGRSFYARISLTSHLLNWVIIFFICRSQDQVQNPD
jgi:hypothetical protein